jgi:large subunit ribosomal protein L22e
MPKIQKATPAAKKAVAAKGPVAKAVKKVVKKVKKGGIGAGRLAVSNEKPLQFIIDCTTPANDGILDVSAFEKFLHDRVKVNGKAGMLGDKVKITRTDAKITVTSVVPFSKRALKYLTKKFLKKNSIRDWLRVIATHGVRGGVEGYVLRYFSIHSEGDDASEEDEAEN